MKKKLQNILLIGSIAVLFCFTSCNTKVNPDIPKTPETEDTPGNTTTPSNPEPSEEKKPLGFEISIADGGMDYGATEVIFEEKTDNTIIETRTTTYKNDLVKTSVITSKPDATKTIVDTYSSGEKFEAEISANGTSTVKAYKNGTELNLEDIVLDARTEFSDYNINTKLLDLISSEDLIKGDVIHLFFYGFCEDNFDNDMGINIASNCIEDDWWLLLCDTYKIPAGSKYSTFVINKDLPVTATSAYDIENYIFAIGSTFSSYENSSSHQESKKIRGYLKLELGTSNRQKPVTLTFNAGEGIASNATETLYPGKFITTSATLNRKFYEWTDTDGNVIWKAPETDMTLTAKWSDKVDLKTKHINKAWENTRYHILFSELKKFPDSVLKISYTNSNPDSSSNLAGSIVLNSKWNTINLTNTTDRSVTRRFLVSDLIDLDPDNEFLLVYDFDESKGFNITELALDYCYCDVTYNMNGGTSDKTSERVPYGEKMIRVPVKEGYVFAGWYDGLSDSANHIVTCPETNNTTLYAHWTRVL